MQKKWLCVDGRWNLFLKIITVPHGGANYIGEDGNGELYTGIVVFMAVGVKKYVTYVVSKILSCCVYFREMVE